MTPGQKQVASLAAAALVLYGIPTLIMWALGIKPNWLLILAFVAWFVTMSIFADFHGELRRLRESAVQISSTLDDVYKQLTLLEDSSSSLRRDVRDLRRHVVGSNAGEIAAALKDWDDQ